MTVIEAQRSGSIPADTFCQKSMIIYPPLGHCASGVRKALAEAAGVDQHMTENKRQLWRYQTSGRSSNG